MIRVDTERHALRFAGRRPGSEKGASLEILANRVAPEAPPLAWARQIHSALVLEARPGSCGEGDALWTERDDVALGVVTADCLPVLFAGAHVLSARLRDGPRPARDRQHARRVVEPERAIEIGGEPRDDPVVGRVDERAVADPACEQQSVGFGQRCQ